MKARRRNAIPQVTAATFTNTASAEPALSFLTAEPGEGYAA